MADEAYEEFDARIKSWALQIGTFILWFGEIEQGCASLWQEFRPGTKIPTGRSRIEGVIKNLKTLDNSAELLAVLQRTLLLIDFRNDIAHNSVTTEVYELEDGTCDSCCVIYGPTSNYRLEMAHLEALVEDARTLASEFSSAFHPFMRDRCVTTAT